VTRTILALAALFSVTVSVGAAIAEKYPEAPVKIVVAFPAGGGIDMLARAMARKLGDGLGQQFIVDNKPGATGQIGTLAVARAKADGYTLLLGASSTHVVSPHVTAHLPYDPLKDFAPITMVARAHNVLVVHPSVPVGNVRELIAYAKAHPGTLTFGSSGTGSNLHLAGELLKMMAGIDMLHVPYKGSAQAMTDLLGGQISVMIDNMPVALPHIRAGKLKVLGIASPDRVAELPDVPTVSETVPGFSVIAWGALLAPAHTPREIVETLNAQAVKALRSPEVVEGFAKQGFVASPTTPEELGTFMRSEFDKWRRVVKEAGIKTE
jgi:tripartite-type tricarboxylate transporter receptor subunit TctC